MAIILKEKCKLYRKLEASCLRLWEPFGEFKLGFEMHPLNHFWRTLREWKIPTVSHCDTVTLSVCVSGAASSLQVRSPDWGNPLYTHTHKGAFIGPFMLMDGSIYASTMDMDTQTPTHKHTAYYLNAAISCCLWKSCASRGLSLEACAVLACSPSGTETQQASFLECQLVSMGTSPAWPTSTSSKRRDEKMFPGWKEWWGDGGQK